MASPKRIRQSVPTTGFVDACLKIANRWTDILQFVLNSVLNLFKICWIMFTKLSRESCLWVNRGWGGWRWSRGNNRNDRRGLRSRRRSLAHILMRRVLLMSTDGSMDYSTERSNFNCLRSRVMSIPNGKCQFRIRGAQKAWNRWWVQKCIRPSKRQ